MIQSVSNQKIYPPVHELCPTKCDIGRIADIAPDSVEKEILKIGPPRNGKIAKLPKELRDLVNGMLADRATGSMIIAALAEHGVC